MALQTVTGVDYSKPTERVELDAPSSPVDYSKPLQRIEVDEAGELVSDSLGTITGKAFENAPEAWQRTGAGLKKSAAEMPQRLLPTILGTTPQTPTEPIVGHDPSKVSNIANPIDPTDGQKPGGLPGVFEAGLDLVQSTIIDQIARDRGQTREEAVAEADAEIERLTQEISQNQPFIREDATGRQIYKDVVTSGVEMAPGLASTILTRRAAPALSQAYGTGMGNTYIEQREAGQAPADAFAPSVISGAAEYIPEKMPVGFLLSKGRGAINKIIGTMAGEGVSEAITEGIQTGVEAGTISPDITLGEALNRMGYASVVGTASGAPYGAMGAAADAVTGNGKKEPLQTPPTLPEEDVSIEQFNQEQGLTAPMDTGALSEPAPAPAVKPTPGTIAELQDVIDNPDTPVEQITALGDGFQLIDMDSGEGTDASGKIWWNPETNEFRSYIEGQPAPVAVPDVMQTLNLEPVREGTKDAPIEAKTAEDVDVAASVTEQQPTEAQKEAGNYRKGHTKVQGLDITIENAKGSTRSGTDANGSPWSVQMPATYGYIKRTEGADGDHVDVYVGENPNSDIVFIIDQIDAETGKFDEHKVMVGFPDKAAAGNAYLDAFNDGRGGERAGDITQMTMADFKTWLKDSDTKSPAGSVAVPRQRGKYTAKDLKVEHIHRDSHSGQHDYDTVVTDKKSGQPIAAAKYSLFENTINMNDVDVRAPFRRKGIATAMYDAIRAKHPGATLKGSMATEDGAAFRQAYDKKNQLGDYAPKKTAPPRKVRKGKAPQTLLEYLASAGGMVGFVLYVCLRVIQS